jgi:hypothetical protein
MVYVGEIRCSPPRGRKKKNTVVSVARGRGKTNSVEKVSHAI